MTSQCGKPGATPRFVHANPRPYLRKRKSRHAGTQIPAWRLNQTH